MTVGDGHIKILIIILAILLIILLLPLRGQVYLKYDNDDIESDFELYLFFVKVKLPEGKQKKNDEDKEEKRENKDGEKSKGEAWNAVNSVLDNLSDIKELISSVLGYVYKHLIKIKME